MRENSIRLGLMPPLTGLVEMYGTEITRVGQIACDEVNESGGVLGRPLELVIEDDGSLPESAVAAATRLVDQHRCTAIIGNLLSNSRIAVAYRVAEPRRIPYLNFSFYEGSILSRYFFHFAALPNQQIDRMIPYMRKCFGSRMFFAGNNYEWPRGSIDAAKRALEQSGGQTVGEIYYPIGIDDKDLEGLLDRVAKSDADVFVPYFAGADQIRMLTRFSGRGLKNRMAVVMGHYDEVMASRLSPEVREGFYSSNTYFMTLATPENKACLARLAAQPGVSGIWPQGNGILTNFGEGTYLCVKAFAKAANLAGSLDPEALVEALEAIAVSGPQGVVQMDRETHHAQVNTYLSRCEADGSFAIIEKFGAIPPALPERYRHLQISKHPSQEDIYLESRMMEQITEAVLLVHATSGAIVYANPGAERMFGYASGGLDSIRFSELFAPSGKSPEKFTAAIGKALSQSGVWQGETENITAGGKHFWCASSISAFTHPKYGEVWMILSKDITERKQAESALSESRTLLKTIVDTAPVRIFWKDRELRYLGCNPEFARDAGEPSPQDIIGKDDFQLGWKEHAELYRADDRQVMDSGTPKLAYEEPQTTPDGKTIWLRTSKVPLRNLADETIGVLGTYQDITEHRLARMELQESEVRLKEAQKVAHLGSWELNLRSNELWWSDETFQIFMVDQTESGASYEAFMNAVHPDDRDAVNRAYTESVKNKTPYDITHRLLLPDGTVKWVNERCETYYDDQGMPLRSIGTTYDITERKKAELLLRSEQELKVQQAVAQKFSSHLQNVREEEKAAIAREIHDNLGSTLTALKMKVFQLKAELPANKEARQLHEYIKSISQLINDASGIARHIITGLQPTILNDLGLLAAIEWQAKQIQAFSDIECVVNCIGDKGGLDQQRSIALFRILQEALTNVVRHSSASRVEIEYHHSDEEVVMSVIDNGVGMTNDHNNDSSHYGIHSMRERAALLGGTINFETPPGGGFGVTVILPLLVRKEDES